MKGEAEYVPHTASQNIVSTILNVQLQQLVDRECHNSAQLQGRNMKIFDNVRIELQIKTHLCASAEKVVPDVI